MQCVYWRTLVTTTSWLPSSCWNRLLRLPARPRHPVRMMTSVILAMKTFKISSIETESDLSPMKMYSHVAGEPQYMRLQERRGRDIRRLRRWVRKSNRQIRDRGTTVRVLGCVDSQIL